MDEFDLKELVRRESPGAFDAYAKHVNPRFARLLRLIGFDRSYPRGEGAYLWDSQGRQYIDCLAAYSALTLGRNHPVVRKALMDVLESGLPNLVHFEAPVLAGVLARELLRRVPPCLTKVFFTNSGTEAVEAAIKFARCATGRAGLIACDRGFHGLTTGALALNGSESLRRGFGPLIESTLIPFGDLAALEQALAPRTAAAFVIEPVQGKGVHIGPDGWLREAAQLCHRHGTLFIADEVQSGVGRCGDFLAIEHDRVDEPDIVVLSKALSGGFVPVGAVLARESVWQATFSSLDRAIVHSSTFHQGTLAMSAGLASLHVYDSEKLAERSASLGARLKRELEALRPRHPKLGEIRGRGLMLAFDLSLARPGAGRLESMLLPQAFLMPLLNEGRVLAQVVNQRSATVKLVPPLVISDSDVTWIVSAIDKALEHVRSSTLPVATGALAAIGANLFSHRARH